MATRTDTLGNELSTESTTTEEWDDIRYVPVSSGNESVLLKYVPR